MPAGCREEREQRRTDIEHLASSLVGKVNECVGAIDEGEYISGSSSVVRIMMPSFCDSLYQQRCYTGVSGAAVCSLAGQELCACHC